MNDDQAYIISTSEYHKNDYYVAHNSNPANSSDSLHSISQDEEKVVDNISDELIRSYLIINLFLFLLFCYTPIHIRNKQRNKSYIFSVKGEL